MTNTLYKKDSKGKIRYWTITCYPSGELVQEAGLVGGKGVVNKKICTPKNVGKKNETSPGVQAQNELRSEYTAKLDEGYFTTIKQAEEEEVILPMLAKSYADEKHKIDWETAIEEPKYDGMRCLAIVRGGNPILKSRDGKTIETLPHIIADLKKIKEDIVLDGELYVHGESFQENMKLIKKYREGETERVKYRLYDTISPKNHLERLNTVGQVINKYNLTECTLTPFNPVKSEDELKLRHIGNIGAGYEGTMIRWGNEGYKVNGRSSNLLKYKDFHDIAAKIVEINPANQRPEWGVPVLEYEGKRFEAGMRYSHAERKDFLTNKDQYIGKTAEIRFFEWTDGGVPRFPVMVGIRLDK